MTIGLRVARVLVAATALALITACTGPSEPRADDPCGRPVAKTGGGNWTCTFADDFRGDRLDPDKWVIQSTALS